MGENINNSMAKMSMPKLDTEDPGSIQAYIDWGTRSGQITPGQATQYQWMQQKAQANRDEQASQGLVRDLRNRDVSLESLNGRLEAATSAGDQAL